MPLQPESSLLCSYSGEKKIHVEIFSAGTFFYTNWIYNTPRAAGTGNPHMYFKFNVVTFSSFALHRAPPCCMALPAVGPSSVAALLFAQLNVFGCWSASVGSSDLSGCDSRFRWAQVLAVAIGAFCLGAASAYTYCWVRAAAIGGTTGFVVGTGAGVASSFFLDQSAPQNSDDVPGTSSGFTQQSLLTGWLGHMRRVYACICHMWRACGNDMCQ
jgi:hypothetical protein